MLYLSADLHSVSKRPPRVAPGSTDDASQRLGTRHGPARGAGGQPGAEVGELSQSPLPCQ
eukprot:2135771-Rhodomonas_salina.2